MSQGKFAARSDDDIHRLVLENPLAWVVSGAEGALRATPLPIRPKFGADGQLEQLWGHFARSNPQHEGLACDPQALILFLGPQGYVSPSWMADRTQAPTWNYASVQFLVTMELVSDPVGVRELLDDLVGAMEQGRPKAWSAQEMGQRYDGLSRGIVGFRARILETRAKFKLGQDERDDVFGDILEGLEAVGGADLHAWMKDFDRRRA